MSEAISVDRSKLKDWGHEFNGYETIVVSDVSVQTARESDQPTNDSIRNFFRRYLPEEPKPVMGKPNDIMKAEEEEVAMAVKAGKMAYIWVHALRPGILFTGGSRRRKKNK